MPDTPFMCGYPLASGAEFCIARQKASQSLSLYQGIEIYRSLNRIRANRNLSTSSGESCGTFEIDLKNLLASSII